MILNVIINCHLLTRGNLNYRCFTLLVKNRAMMGFALNGSSDNETKTVGGPAFIVGCSRNRGVVREILQFNPL